MGFYQFFTISNKKYEISNTDNFKLAGVSDDFLFWFAGFTDA